MPLRSYPKVCMLSLPSYSIACLYLLHFGRDLPSGFLQLRCVLYWINMTSIMGEGVGGGRSRAGLRVNYETTVSRTNSIPLVPQPIEGSQPLHLGLHLQASLLVKALQLKINSDTQK